MFSNPLQFEIQYECLQDLQNGATAVLPRLLTPSSAPEALARVPRARFPFKNCHVRKQETEPEPKPMHPPLSPSRSRVEADLRGLRGKVEQVDHISLTPRVESERACV